MKRNSIILALAAAIALPAASLLFTAPATAAPQKKGGDVLSLKHTITDDAIVYPESFETDTRKLLEGWYMKNYTATDNRYDTEMDADVPDEEIIRRLAAMPTVIDMPFNSIVRNYIDRYTKRGRRQVAAMLGLGLYYMPIFEQALESAGLPLELKYLPVVESGLDPNAVSRHGATGLWQFMIAPAKGFDMEVNSLIDERRDPYVSSAKAAAFLKDLYSTYGDWTLAIAAYNCGPGTVNKALRRAGGDPKSHDFWSIYSYLPSETRGYVPMFIAANYVMTYYPEHNISPVLPTKPLVTDTVGISSRVHFNQISKVLDIPVDELRVLNPQFRADIIPGSPEKSYSLILPSQQVHAYIMSEDQIMAYDADRYARRLTAEPDAIDASGDDLLAEEPYNPADLAPAEEAAGEALAAAETSAPVSPAPAPAATPARRDSGRQTAQTVNTPGKTKGKTRTVTHKVEQGETLAEIAAMYEVSVADIRNWNGLRRNAVRAGQQLRVETAVASTAGKGKTQTAKPAAPKKNRSESADTGSKGKKQTSQRKKTETRAAADHEVKSGENLSTIAKRYGVSVEELRKANGGMQGDMLHPGDKVKLPKKGKAAAGKGKKGKSAATKKGSGKKGKGSASGTSKKKGKKRR